MSANIVLTEMKRKEKGKVIDVDGGIGVKNRLSAMGIRPGVKIIKISTALGRGAVVVQTGRVQTALGYGMAGKVIVEVER